MKELESLSFKPKDNEKHKIESEISREQPRRDLFDGHLLGGSRPRL